MAAWFEHIFLGALQGLAEFLPVSSSGHLIIARHWLGLAGSSALAVDAVLHFATALAVCIYFRHDISFLIRHTWQWLTGREYATFATAMVCALAVATVPAVIIGLALEDIMATLFRNPVLVSGALIVGSILMVVAERISRHRQEVDALTSGRALIVGLFQSLALIPGMSRSGMAIVGGMSVGLNRSAAARFAFLLAVPVLLGAGAKKIFDLAGAGADVAVSVIVMAAAVAFLTGLLSIHILLAVVRRYSLLPFVYYRLALAALVLILI